MDETQDFVKYIKDKFDETEIKLAKFVLETDLLTYTMLTEKVKEDNIEVDKPTNVLELAYLKLCDRKLPDIENLFEKIFINYIGYIVDDSRNWWKLNLNNLSNDLKFKCSYCNIESNGCPFKLVAYIKKGISDNKFDKRKVLDLLGNRENKEYTSDEFVINSVVTKINEYISNTIDVVGAEMVLNSNIINIEKEEDGKIYYKYVDFSVRNNSFFNNLIDFYKYKQGILSEFNYKDVKFEKSNSYIFDISPIKLAVYIKYLCMTNNIDERVLIKALLKKRNFSEKEYKIAYYNQYINQIDKLECSEEEKNEVKEIITYMFNFYFNESLPYIHFNIAIYTKNNILSDKVVNIISRFARTSNYVGPKSTLWVDSEMLIKRTKDSTDTISQVENIYSKNDIVIFENFDKLKKLNEYRVEGLYTALEKFNNRNRKSMAIFIGSEKIIKEAYSKYPALENTVINKCIHLNSFDSNKIAEKIIEKLNNVSEIDENFKEKLKDYIDTTYNPENISENIYISNVASDIIYNKYKILNPDKIFVEKDISSNDGSRALDEILNDINSLVGLDDVKKQVKELIEYLNYTKKIDLNGFANLNMIFKGNSGTGKTTVSRLFAELFCKLGFIKQNKIIEVMGKDFIGSHVGETAPKTQAIIESALDGVLFIDEAYTLMSGKSNSNFTAECIATISKAMDLYKDRLIVIFAGSEKEMNDFINCNSNLMARIGYYFDFPSFSKKELIQIFNDEVNGNEFKLEDGVIDKVSRIISRECNSKGFGNARFIKNLFDRLVVIHGGNCTDNEKLKLIENKDVDNYIGSGKESGRTVDEILEELNSLIGLENVKEQMNGFVSLIELNRKLDRSSDFNMHMIFKGNSGTGKTTVARLLSEIYYNLGYIKRNKFVEVQSQDLIGEFLGQTGPKTQAIIDSALDGVLFIDEAYAIMEHNGNNTSYSAECVATLLKAMEDYAGRLIIIFAGYTEEMRKFRDLNPGLKSRIGYEINFEDYTIEELLEIYNKKVLEKGFKTDEEAMKEVEKIISESKNIENFGNGRFVENTIQKIIINHAVKTRGIEDTERLLTFTKEDIPDIRAEESKRKIGF